MFEAIQSTVSKLPRRSMFSELFEERVLVGTGGGLVLLRGPVLVVNAIVCSRDGTHADHFALRRRTWWYAGV